MGTGGDSMGCLDGDCLAIYLETLEKLHFNRSLLGTGIPFAVFVTEIAKERQRGTDSQITILL